ncbi:conserved hypothetical protein [Aster yellows witches'-broom phytoplasma AYWB]|uniref:Sequence-variable mosaic (SVM) signal sequence domain-containing protein n=2 Tax=16SrI (Aster yellows group) TaxID=3042590 RepID=Q2NK93_AYWBP|nr:MULTISPECIES: SVM family protein [16SrI (Aster yellows group)]ABC65150.1 conserved hypothetical protein [Aster yellows witches'-broom phytoplasma AYWB]PEH36444.1 effector protein [New Jersey aster yellows phytoplasma]
MFKLKNQFKKKIIFLFVFLGLLFINNKSIYAFPGIDLDVRRHQLEEELNNLLLELNNVFNNMSLDSSTRFNMMVAISNTIDTTNNQLSTINQQIIERDRCNQQRRNYQNKPNSPRRI